MEEEFGLARPNFEFRGLRFHPGGSGKFYKAGDCVAQENGGIIVRKIPISDGSYRSLEFNEVFYWEHTHSLLAFDKRDGVSVKKKKSLQRK